MKREAKRTKLKKKILRKAAELLFNKNPGDINGVCYAISTAMRDLKVRNMPLRCEIQSELAYLFRDPASNPHYNKPYYLGGDSMLQYALQKDLHDAYTNRILRVNAALMLAESY